MPQQGDAFRNIDQRAFERVQEYSTTVGLPGKAAHDEQDEIIDGGIKVLRWGVTKDEAARLKSLAEEKGIWNDPELVYYRQARDVRRMPMK